MPYLQVDLDAKKLFGPCAAAAGVPVGTIAWGLLELWEYAWTAKAQVVGELILDGCFGSGERTRQALEAFGFLEKVASGWRVRGATRYLRISEARREGGRRNAKNLKQYRLPTGSPPAPHRLPTGSSRRSAGDQPVKTHRVPPALTPNTEHRTPNTSSSPSENVAPSDSSDASHPTNPQESPRERKESRQEHAYSVLEATREIYSNQTGEHLPDDPRPPPAAINSRIKAAFKLLGSDDPHALADVYRDFFLGGDFAREAHWPIPVFLSDKVFRQRAERARKTQEVSRG